MIKYNLKCECGNFFESWFSSSKEYELLLKKKLINCIYCQSTKISKSVMAPNLSSKTKKNYGNKKIQKDVKKKLLEFRRYVEKNCKDVGDQFPQEARSIHYDKKSSGGIYGKATPEETQELLEEGIEVSTIPWPDKSEN
jgi:hypothetical protein